jgi:AcrR family transcriptional regulator
VPRVIPEHRLKDLLECATRVFLTHGYRRTQMSDIAEAMGVAKGTVYLYVESKEALFAAVLRHADSHAPSPSGLELPIPAPKPGAVLRMLRERLAQEVAPPALQKAKRRKRVTDVRSELETIVRELFALASRYRTVIKLIDRCGADHPELASTFYEHGRFAQLELLRGYLNSRIRRGRLRAVPDAALAARFVIETIATWAVHIHWDPAPQRIDAHEAEEIVVHFILGGLLTEPTK